MYQKVNNRVSEVIRNALDNTHYSVTSLAEALGVSRNSIYRWADKKSEKIEEDHLDAISKTLNVNLEWLKYGKSGLSDHPKIVEIEQHVAEKGESYKGLERAISDVVSKANSLKQDLTNLLENLEKLKNDSLD